jgi:hypothetical protein
LIAAAISRSKGEVKAGWEKVYKMTGMAACYVVLSITLINQVKTESLNTNKNLTVYTLCESIQPYI